MDPINKTLTEFGLNDSEIKVYLQCLKEDSLTPFKIAKLTNIPRTTVYDILLNLSLKGLIDLQQSQGFEKQQTKIHAKNPFIIREILQNKRKQLFELEADVIQILPQLKSDFLHTTLPPNIQYFPGKEGLKKVYFGETEFTDATEAFVFDNRMPMDVMSREEINDEINQFHHQYSQVAFKMTRMNSRRN